MNVDILCEKITHRCLFCPSRASQGVWKAVVVSKLRKKHFYHNPQSACMQLKYHCNTALETFKCGMYQVALLHTNTLTEQLP